MWVRVSQFVEKKQPEKVATGRAMELFNDSRLTFLQHSKREEETNLFGQVFWKWSAGKCEENVAKKAKTNEEESRNEI